MQHENAHEDAGDPEAAEDRTPGRAQTPAASCVDADIAAIHELQGQIRSLWANLTAPSREDLRVRLELLWTAADRRDTDSRPVREALQQVLLTVGLGALATLSEETRQRLSDLTGISLPGC
ncbi:hypothetical protein [Streptacidiphilus anmyonensis]|uniref:hypothetical protein n=1 Tax=Streptacidiphilus anmyonensis TaxID=405782 RepID=UPI0005AA804E|nr:hypothetical protein [Streptacidiphilus anmyonensis]